MLQFAKDVVRHDVIDVYVEHIVYDTFMIMDPSEIENYIDDDEVQCTGFSQPNAEVNEDQGNVTEGNADVHENNVSKPEVEVNEPNVSGPKAELNEPNVEVNNEQARLNYDYYVVSEASGSKWPADMQYEECEDSDNLYTLYGNEGDEDVVKFPTYKSGETAHNTNVKTTWLAKKIANVPRHNPYIKPTGIVAESLKRWGVKISQDETYREKRKAMNLIQGVDFDQFNHLRRYIE
ncbi:hypothetical protein KIW84_060544 [Lathyrus oleraceus]|uniref:Uncharacterized protein n=1 Tax=Pisum sativum TaxID=3888 RepID=A0A9D4W0F5_PEA|nr:hypothetical protein KIW84_060544 [Pisum sativum]